MTPGRRHSYFAYGSNLCVRQMAQRCPDARAPRRAVLAGHDWLINQRGVATIEPLSGTDVHGVVWQISEDDLAVLDSAEGVPERYRRDRLTVQTDDGPVNAWVYVDHRVNRGPPRPGYLERIVGGAEYHGLPQRWIGFLRRWDHTMATSGFRFAVGIHSAESGAGLRDKAKRLEDSGFDTLHVPDHLGAPAPFPVLSAIAAATSTVRLGTYVLNAGFYKPALLGRDAGELDKLSGGRLDLGLGAGYVREEFAAAELPYPTARQRVDYLEHVTVHLKKQLPSVPILIAGNGNRLLTVAARHADTIGLTGAGNADAADPLAERIDFVRSAAGDRFQDLELNLGITAVPSDNSGKPDLALTRRFVKLPDEKLLALPAVLSGSPRDIADTLLGYRQTYGLTSFTFQENHVDTIAKVIAELR